MKSCRMRGSHPCAQYLLEPPSTRIPCRWTSRASRRSRLIRKVVRRNGGWRWPFGLVLAAKLLVQPAFQPAANGQHRESDGQCDDHHAPLSETADDSDAGRQPGTGSTGETANPEMTPGVDDDACAKKSDSGQDSLYDPA